MSRVIDSMPESLVQEILVDSVNWEQDGRELFISENQTSVFEVHFRTIEELDQFCHSIMRRNVGTGESAIADNVLLLRFSAFSTYIVSRQQKLENFKTEHQDHLTDITHGKCVLVVQGDSVLEFLGDYCSTDILSVHDRHFGMIKTRSIDYELAIWWDSKDRINLMIDRIYALSFVEFLHSLFTRR